MRNPFRSEAEAFRFTLLVVGLGIAVALGGIFGGGWVALGVFLALALGICVGVYLRRQPEPTEPAVWERTGKPRGRRRILVVANETCTGRAMLDEVRYRARNYDAEVFVVAPALNSHLRHWTSDVDGAIAAARERLNRSLAALLASGVRADGDIGDSDPLQAIEDALRTFDPDEIIVSTHPPGRSNWLERDVVGKARERFPLPITHVVVDLDREQATVPSA
jgi:GABA permease